MYNKWHFTACRPSCSCCPSVEKIITVDNQVMVQIADDYNGTVVLTPEEMLLIAQEYKKAYENGEFSESDS